jgi:hypothetical protein
VLDKAHARRTRLLAARALEVEALKARLANKS